jgi:hypothetical protein
MIGSIYEFPEKNYGSVIMIYQVQFFVCQNNQFYGFDYFAVSLVHQFFWIITWMKEPWYRSTSVESVVHDSYKSNSCLTEI